MRCGHCRGEIGRIVGDCLEVWHGGALVLTLGRGAHFRHACGAVVVFRHRPVRRRKVVDNNMVGGVQ